MAVIVQDNDPHYSAAWLRPSTSRADLTLNDLRARNVGCQIIIREMDRNDPPGSPDEMDAYLIGPNPTLAWTGLPGRLVVWNNGWKFIPVVNGMRVMVNSGLQGQQGHAMDFWTSGWAAHGASQDLDVFDAGGSQFEADWNMKYGEVARLLLTESTVTMNLPFGVRFGRIHVLIVKQDLTGNRALALKAGQWLVPGGGAVEQPTQAANAETVYTFIQPGAAHVGSILLSVTHDVLPT